MHKWMHVHVGNARPTCIPDSAKKCNNAAAKSREKKIAS